MTVPHRPSSLGAWILSVGALFGVASAAEKPAAHGVRGQKHIAARHAPAGATPAQPVHAATAARRRHALHGVQGRRVEEVTVTGSMLSTSRNSNANPVQVVTSKQIMQTGITNLGDYLQRLPSIGSSGTSNAQTNGTGGASCSDIRNLGQQRVLVLIDGKRTALNGQSSCVDMNTIPVQLVQSIEILKDGGSELYGADAVSGVINIKLRHDVNDANITIRGGVTGHGDGQQGLLSAYKGWNFDEGRGNITVFGSYNTTSGISMSSRGWASPVQMDLNGRIFGSSYSPQGQAYDLNGNKIGPTAPRYDFTKQTSLTNSIHTGTLYGDAHYKFDRHFTLYSNVLYSHRNSLAQMAAVPFYGSIPPSGLPSSLWIPQNNPFNPYGQDVTISKRFNEFGPRRDENASDTYTAKVGLKGEIAYNWMYDASFTYGWNQVSDRDLNTGNYTRLLQAYGLRQTRPGDPTSGTTFDPSLCPNFGCSNPFGPLSPRAAAYANATTNTHSYYQLRDWNLRIHNNRVATMPWEHGGRLGIALGMEHRGEQLSQTPDPLISSGQSMNGTQLYTGGGFQATEGYLEGSLNLLHNAFLAKDLTIDGQGRISGYNTFGVTKNWKASINWMPVRDVHFRGTLGTAYRQPSVYELYSGQYLSYETGVDPCDASHVGSYGANAAMVAANCARRGIDSSSFQAQGGGQVPTLMGGSRNLQPETSRTYTFGVELTPRWIPRLSASVEYWHTRVKNTITTLQTQYILDQCYTGANEAYCNAIKRSPNGGQIQTVDNFYINAGGLRTDGIDFDLNYSFILSPYDVLSLNNNLQQIITYQQQFVTGGQWYNYAGRLLYQNSGAAGQPGGIPHLRDYATVTWRHNHFSITYMMQYMSGMVWNDASRDLTSADARRHATPGMFEHDVTMAYRVGKWNFEGGINNITNKKPPFVASAVDNSSASLYGNYYLGRYFFLQAGVNF